MDGTMAEVSRRRRCPAATGMGRHGGGGGSAPPGDGERAWCSSSEEIDAWDMLLQKQPRIFPCVRFDSCSQIPSRAPSVASIHLWRWITDDHLCGCGLVDHAIEWMNPEFREEERVDKSWKSKSAQCFSFLLSTFPIDRDNFSKLIKCYRASRNIIYKCKAKIRSEILNWHTIQNGWGLENKGLQTYSCCWNWEFWQQIFHQARRRTSGLELTHTKKKLWRWRPHNAQRASQLPYLFYILINTKDGPKPSRLSKGGPH
jgi:hypothetical protein